MGEPVKIEITKLDVQGKTDSEKLSILVEIAFANHQLLDEHGKILFGNGDPKKGICYQVASQGTKMNWLWGAFTVVTGAVFLILIKHIMG